MRSNFPLRTTPRFIDLKSDLEIVFGNILSLNLNYFWGRKENFFMVGDVKLIIILLSKVA